MGGAAIDRDGSGGARPVQVLAVASAAAKLDCDGPADAVETIVEQRRAADQAIAHAGVYPHPVGEVSSTFACGSATRKFSLTRNATPVTLPGSNPCPGRLTVAVTEPDGRAAERHWRHRPQKIRVADTNRGRAAAEERPSAEPDPPVSAREPFQHKAAVCHLAIIGAVREPVATGADQERAIGDPPDVPPARVAA